MVFLADLVPLGAVAYAAAVFMTEWVIRMVFWALAQREKDIEKRRAEGRAIGVQEGLAQGLTQGWTRGRTQMQESILLSLAAAGITVPAGIISGDPVGRDAVLLESGDVYASPVLGLLHRKGQRGRTRIDSPAGSTTGVARRLVQPWLARTTGPAF